MVNKTTPICHICGGETYSNYICERCGEYYCENCSALFTPHNQIDYNCCNICSDDGYDNF